MSGIVDFLVIGAMKCGTSSLYKYLARHPSIDMSRLKETDFFCTEKNWHMGLGWYESLYPPRREGAIRGEASPNYSKWPTFSGVPERIRAVSLDVKLVYLIRDPVARTVSHYLHNVAEGTETRPFEEIVRSGPNGHYVICSRYFTQLQQYSGYFAADQILVVKAEDLRDRRRSALRKIFGFLDVDESFWDASFDRVYQSNNHTECS